MISISEDLDVFSCALRSSREYRGWTHKEVGDAADLGQNQIALLERGDRSPTLSTMVRICRGAFQMSLADFLMVGVREQQRKAKATEEPAHAGAK